ncbi:ATPase AAA [Desulfosarcina alkanivorans]|uniref:ATPase AAA n=1 Tax=Desulfosarcina alkanivorans TaxID=571177 RepID=A0A5K7YQX2_9BACT|nr:AAA family ATPase [Desulfosarcina alkanivorans]BBO70299.1 ATPase AAA [Desulfosarcina alkanivorans]
MYNRFFGFKERPFKLVPNPAYLYLSRIHEEVLAHLNYAVGYGEGFVEITGEVGTGKTTLCRMFLENLDDTTEAAYIFNPKLDALQLLKAINDEFGIDSDTDSVKTLIDRLNHFLLEKKAQGRRVLLLVDEAQNLSADVLEQLRLLSNLETNTSKLLQIILVGQPELGELLDTEALRQLNQRITLSCHLIPLGYSETREYIRHRIHIASRKPGLDFTAGAYRSIFRYTGGVPRLINIACDRALLTAFTLGKHRITNRIVKRALRELDGKRSRSRPPVPYREKLVIGLLVVLVILVGGLVAGQTLFSRIGGLSLAPVVHHKIETPPADPSPAVPPEPAEQGAEDVIGPATAPGSDPPEAKAPAAAAPDVMAAAIDPESPSPARELEQAITSMGALDSRTAALTAVLRQWKVPHPMGDGPVGGLDGDMFFRTAARNHAMEVLRVQGSLDLIRGLNLPAIMEFPHPDGSAVRFLAVVGLADGEIRLTDGATTFSIPPASLAGLWNGVAHVLWKNYFNYTGVIPISSPGDVILSLKMHLKALGFAIEEMNAAYDTVTRAAVEAIQARNGLEVDGMVGPLTKIALYNEDQTLNVPRLADAPGG